jgi:hypothetical protein
VFKIRRKNALAEHIIMSFKSKAAQAQLVACAPSMGALLRVKVPP